MQLKPNQPSLASRSRCGRVDVLDAVEFCLDRILYLILTLPTGLDVEGLEVPDTCRLPRGLG